MLCSKDARVYIRPCLAQLWRLFLGNRPLLPALKPTGQSASDSPKGSRQVLAPRGEVLAPAACASANIFGSSFLAVGLGAGVDALSFRFSLLRFEFFFSVPGNVSKLELLPQNRARADPLNNKSAGGPYAMAAAISASTRRRSDGKVSDPRANLAIELQQVPTVQS